MAERFEDERGVIEDLLITPLDGMTRITTRAGAVRGNHVHEHTTQWVYVVEGRLFVRWGDREADPLNVMQRVLLPGELHEEVAGVAHAWLALTDCTVLVLTQGPRTGENYENDTVRLDDRYRLIIPGMATP